MTLFKAWQYKSLSTFIAWNTEAWILYLNNNKRWEEWVNEDKWWQDRPLSGSFKKIFLLCFVKQIWTRFRKKKVSATEWLLISLATAVTLGHMHRSCINILQIFIKPGCGFCAIWQSTRGAWRGASIVNDHCTAEGWGLNDKVRLTP